MCWFWRDSARRHDHGEAHGAIDGRSGETRVGEGRRRGHSWNTNTRAHTQCGNATLAPRASQNELDDPLDESDEAAEASPVPNVDIMVVSPLDESLDDDAEDCETLVPAAAR